MPAAFKPGDQVQLKSGGPVMTVENVGDYSPGPNPGVVCIWFSNMEVMTRVFSPETLDHYS